MELLYYSKKLNQTFKTPEACEAAEAEYDKKEAEKKALSEKRSTRAKEIEAAFKKSQEAHKEYQKLLKDFIKDFGSYHATYTADTMPISLFDSSWVKDIISLF